MECQISWCREAAYRRGYCNPHRLKMKRHGNPYGPGTLLEALTARVLTVGISDDACWAPLGTTADYGYVSMNDFPVSSHRAAYEVAYGDIPEGLEIDHKCRNKLCWNPAHLEAVTHSENNRRKFDGGCKAGHEWTEENTYIHPQRGTRNCKQCAKDRAVLRQLAKVGG